MFQVGERVGPYTLVREVGAGASGVVWLAEKRSGHNPPYALKFPRTKALDLDALREEARLWSRLNHQNVLPLMEAEAYDGHFTLVSRFMPDGSMGQWLRAQGGRIPSIDAAVELVVGILRGLEYLHGQLPHPIVHRDLKPGNILMQGNNPLIADFGLSRFLTGEVSTTAVSGTPAYMAPEVWTKSDRCAEADLWAVGVIFYECLVGRKPFRGSTIEELRVAILNDEPEALPSGVPERLCAVIGRALQKDKSRRFHTATETLAAVEDWDETTFVVAPSPLPPRPVLCCGRAELLARLVEWMSGPSSRGRGLPVVGVGGIGKSTLALTALHDGRVAMRYGDRRHFVRLDSAANREAVVAAISRAVGVPLGEHLEARLLAHLEREGPWLLVLDNAETPLLGADGPATRKLLEGLVQVPTVTAVATLRPSAPLTLGWEVPVPVRPLDDGPAREIFLAHTCGLFGDDPLFDQVLGRLEGHPLAVTLLANQARYYADLQELESVWEERRTGLLTGGGKGPDADLDACIVMSLDSPQMTPEGKRLLALLGVLPDGVRRQDLPELLPGVGLKAAADLRRVGGLAFDDGPRLRVLAPIRERLAQRCPLGEAEPDFARAAGWYCGLAGELAARGRGDGAAAFIARVNAEAGNLVRMIRAVLASVGPQKAFSAIISLAEFNRFGRVLQGARGVELPALIKEAIGVAERAKDRAHEGTLLRIKGDMEFDAHKNRDLAREAYSLALELFGQAGDTAGEASCLHGQAELALWSREEVEARKLFDAALAKARLAGERGWEVRCLIGLAEIDRLHYHFDQSRIRTDEALAMARSVPDIHAEARCISGLGDLAMSRAHNARRSSRGDDAAAELRQASRHYAEALTLFQKAGSVLGEATCLRGLANVAMKEERLEEATDGYRKAYALFAQAGIEMGQASCLRGQADAALARSDWEVAERLLEPALQLSRRLAWKWGIAACLSGLGNAALRGKQPEVALRHFEEALPLFSHEKAANQVAYCSEKIAEIRRSLG